MIGASPMKEDSWLQPTPTQTNSRTKKYRNINTVIINGTQCIAYMILNTCEILRSFSSLERPLSRICKLLYFKILSKIIRNRLNPVNRKVYVGSDIRITTKVIIQ